MTLSEMCLVLLVFLLAVATLALVALSERRLGASPRDQKKRVWAAAVGTGVWLSITGLAAHEGLLLDFDAFPPPVARVAVPTILLVLFLVLSPMGGRLVRGLKFSELIGFQAFRLPVEMILFAFLLEGKIPRLMTFEGRNFDVLTAVGAVFLAVHLSRRARGPECGHWLIWLWNVMGLFLLGNVVGIAILTAPGPWNRFPGSPVNTLPFHWPTIWILYCVALALLGHLLIFRKLVQRI